MQQAQAGGKGWWLCEMVAVGVAVRLTSPHPHTPHPLTPPHTLSTPPPPPPPPPQGCEPKGLFQGCPQCLLFSTLDLMWRTANHLELIKANPVKDPPHKVATDRDVARMAFGEDLEAAGGTDRMQKFEFLMDSRQVRVLTLTHLHSPVTLPVLTHSHFTIPLPVRQAPCPGLTSSSPTLFAPHSSNDSLTVTHPHILPHSPPPPPPHSLSQCGKLRVLDYLLRQFRDEGKKALVFSNSVRLLRIIEHFVIATYGANYLMLHGEVPEEARKQIVVKFNNNEVSGCECDRGCVRGTGADCDLIQQR